MGTKRVEGKVKKKSIKAKVTSKFSAKRKLSRMGKKVKKGQMGPSTEFITRSAVLKRLQITLKDFRRLCILKGIYPRVPDKAPNGSDKIYYDIKDISYLAHEPLLAKFREFKTFMRKIRKSAGRNEIDDARRKDRIKPVMKMDHLVKERYPRIIDAIRDLEDPLCMIHLFAAMPSVGRITAEKTNNCRDLARQWQYIVMKSKTLRKVFCISERQADQYVFSVYFQAELMGEQITWLVPHPFTQVVPKEVDVRVMITFLEFYEVYLKFVLYKLYRQYDLHYPPVFDKSLDEAGCALLSIKVNSVNSDHSKSVEANTKSIESDPSSHETITQPQSKKRKFNPALLNSLKQKLNEGEIGTDGDMDEDDDDEGDENEPSISGPLSEAFNSLKDEGQSGIQEDESKVFSVTDEDLKKVSNLFHKKKFFINREVPLDWLQLCTLGLGATEIGWEGALSPFTAADPMITHHIVDRPMLGAMMAGREYVQPQWIFDCINAQMLLPVSLYKPGAKLPPHLSPFVDDDKEGYLPKYREEILKLQNPTSVATSKLLDDRKNELVKDDDDDKEEDDEEEEEDQDKKFSTSKTNQSSSFSSKKRKTENRDDSDDDDDVPEEASKPMKYEEKKTSSGIAKGPKAIVFKPHEKKLTEDKEASELSKLMMTKKTKRLYDRMTHGIDEKKAIVNTLVEKRARLESSKSEVLVTSTARKNKNK